ncbi:MAG: CHRD domain-containing protein [Candidatus Nitrosocosmicus sp.]
MSSILGISGMGSISLAQTDENDNISNNQTFVQNQTNTVQQTQPQQFSVTLSGQNVVPIVQDTQAKGIAEFRVSPQLDSIDYNISVRDIDQVLASYVQLGTPGVNGPIILILYRADSPTSSINGLLAEDVITSNELEGPMEGKSIADLVNAMNNGNTYISISTASYPNGEIRGEISSP